MQDRGAKEAKEYFAFDAAWPYVVAVERLAVAAWLPCYSNSFEPCLALPRWMK